MTWNHWTLFENILLFQVSGEFYWILSGDFKDANSRNFKGAKIRNHYFHVICHKRWLLRRLWLISVWIVMYASNLKNVYFRPGRFFLPPCVKNLVRDNNTQMAKAATSEWVFGFSGRVLTLRAFLTFLQVSCLKVSFVRLGCQGCFFQNRQKYLMNRGFNKCVGGDQLIIIQGWWFTCNKVPV